MGLGAVLSRIREPEESTSYSLDYQPEVKRSRPLNRKERRALKQAELKESYENISAIKIPDYKKATPPVFKIIEVDEQAFQNYNASFGYNATRNNNYVRYSLLGPSGQYAAVASQDRYVRVYKLENDKPHIHWKHNMGGLVYDIKFMNNDKFLVTSKEHPIHAFDAETGERVGAYIGRDHADAVEAAMCVGMVGDTVIGGYKKDFKLWNVERGGKPVSNFPYYDKKSYNGLTGRAMSICAHPSMPNIFAAVGCCDRIAVYSDKWKSPISTIETNTKSYTHVLYSSDGMKLYASERKGDIHCFDLRMNMMCQILKREMTTNHRAIFDIDSSLLFSGTSSGEIVAYDIGSVDEELEPISKTRIASTCVPCVSVASGKLVACSGERIFPSVGLCDTDEENENQLDSFTLYPANSFQFISYAF
ncbi:unnamed protein product [Caenorhabditis bovis]|uniref:WD repeat-containing protein 55 homolog n=1 Tax=Caenorhabditis bovis TaxID=2654633 RepID=A0A8S1FDT8_9PELO|nr:unnamed protein product [Caenorhabditis bovis]